MATGGPRRVAVIRAGALGDVLLGVPALQALRRLFPDSALTLVAPGAAGRFAARNCGASAFLSVDDPLLLGLFAGRPELPPALESTDLALVWMREPAGSELARTLERAGVQEVRVTPPFSPELRVHAADWLLRSVEALGQSKGVVKAANPLRDDESELSTQQRQWDVAPWLHALPRSPEPGSPQARIVVHPGSGSGRKNWSPECWTRVLAAVPRSVAVQAVCGPADTATLDAFLHATREQGLRIEVVRPPDIEALARAIAGAAVYLGNDSGVSHLAAGLGILSVVVFGPTDPELWRPRGPAVTVLGGAEVPPASGLFATDARWPEVDSVTSAALSMLRR